MKFSDTLRKLRTEKGLSQIEIAKAIGVAKSTYSLYESGKREPDVLKIKKIAKVLGVTGDDLLQINTSDYIPSSEAMTIAQKFDTLNDLGKQKAKDYINDLTENQKYLSALNNNNDDDDENITFSTYNLDDDAGFAAAYEGIDDNDDTTYHT